MRPVRFPDNTGWQEPGWPAADTETSCRFCGELIRKRRDRSGNGFEWVSYLGIQPGSGREIHMFSRFCRDPDDTFPRRRLKRQHGPIPLHDLQKLDSWLES